MGIREIEGECGRMGIGDWGVLLVLVGSGGIGVLGFGIWRFFWIFWVLGREDRMWEKIFGKFCRYWNWIEEFVNEEKFFISEYEVEYN